MKIIPVAFSARDLSDFESVLSLAASRMTNQWTLGTPADSGDFHIVLLSRPDDLSALLRDSPALDPWRVIAYAGDGCEVEAHWKISRREGSPPRLSELISVFNAIDQYVKEAGSGEPEHVLQASKNQEVSRMAQEPHAAELSAQDEYPAVEAILPGQASRQDFEEGDAFLPQAESGDTVETETLTEQTALDEEPPLAEEPPAMTLLERIGRWFGVAK